jgi:predicted dehydrogenase
MIKIAIISPSEIAFRRFIPALQKTDGIQFMGVAFASPQEWFGRDLTKISPAVIEKQQKDEIRKAQEIIEMYGGEVFNSYDAIISNHEIDAVYIPLPPALHFKWAKRALENGKHVLVEKPATTQHSNTNDLVKIAQSNSLVLHENYMFIFHKQLKILNEVVANGEIGEVRLYRITFGFPRRDQNDFRYNSALGGGALLDAGGYTLKYANYLLGESAEIKCTQLNYLPDFDVDVFGSATLVNKDDVTAQIAFGMDNDYKCEIEIWGSKGTIVSNRILTAPSGFTPTYTIKNNGNIETKDLPEDDSFYNSILHFKESIKNALYRKKNYEDILRQSELVSNFLNKAK